MRLARTIAISTAPGHQRRTSGEAVPLRCWIGRRRYWPSAHVIDGLLDDSSGASVRPPLAASHPLPESLEGMLVGIALPRRCVRAGGFVPALGAPAMPMSWQTLQV